MMYTVFWLALLIVIVSYMTLWYAIALYTRRYDTVDSAWGLGFVLTAWVGLGVRDNFGWLQVVSAGLVSLWGLRLFTHIAGRNWRKHEDDRRYQILQEKWRGTTYKLYTNIFLLQGVLIVLISLPVSALAFARQQPNAWSYVGWVVWLGGIIFEAIADWQLTRFVARRSKNSHVIMDHGLWRYSRHPNYFGEIVTWWGAAIVAWSVGAWWGVLGALIITLLITKISGIPPLERRYDGDTAYAAYRKRTSVLIPWKPKAAA